MKLLGLIAVVLLSGCATQSDFDRVNKSIINGQYLTDQQFCSRYGFGQGTDQHRDCLRFERGTALMDTFLFGY